MKTEDDTSLCRWSLLQCSLSLMLRISKVGPAFQSDAMRNGSFSEEKKSFVNCTSIYKYILTQMTPMHLFSSLFKICMRKCSFFYKSWIFGFNFDIMKWEFHLSYCLHCGTIILEANCSRFPTFLKDHNLYFMILNTVKTVFPFLDDRTYVAFALSRHCYDHQLIHCGDVPTAL